MASYVNKETDRTQARRARDRPPGHVYFSALGVTCQLDALPSPSPSTSSPRVVPAVRPFDPDVPDAAEPWGGHLRPSGTASLVRIVWPRAGSQSTSRL